MSDNTPDWETLWVDLAMGELSREELEALERRLEADPGQKARLQALRREIGLLRHIPAGPPLPTSVVVPSQETSQSRPEMRGLEAGDGYKPETLPPALEARIKSIFRTEPQSPTGTRQLWQRLRSGARWQWAVAAAAVLVLVVVVPHILNQPDTDFVIKDADMTASPPRRAPVGLSLVTRDTPDGPVYRLPLEKLAPGLHGCRVRSGQSLLPVLQNREVDLDVSNRYVRVLLLDSTNAIRTLASSEKAIRLARLPDTEHLFALPEPIILPEAPPLTSGLYRLYVLATASQISDIQLERAVSKRTQKNIREPGSLLDPAFSNVEGIEGTILLEVP